VDAGSVAAELWGSLAHYLEQLEIVASLGEGRA
jgi:hypothetical protein